MLHFAILAIRLSRTNRRVVYYNVHWGSRGHRQQFNISELQNKHDIHVKLSRNTHTKNMLPSDNNVFNSQNWKDHACI